MGLDTARHRVPSWVLLLCVLSSSTCVHASPAPSPERPGIAFFYGAHTPVAELSHFGRVVVEPGNVSAGELATLQESSTVFAYLSVGEVSRSSPSYAQVRPSWILAENEAWSSSVIDPLVEEVRAFLISRAEELWAQGYRGFFLDTLDSPLAVPASDEVRRARALAFVALAREMHERLPGVRLLLNRGFELFPEVAPFAEALVAESLFARWNAAARRYEPVPDADRTWLLARLQEVRQRHGLPVVVIDYVAPAERQRARAVARDIQALGFIPYVTNARLDILGVGEVEVIPRKVLALYDGAAGGPADSSLHRWLAMPLEALGLTLDYRDVREPLPEEPLVGRYAGVVGWVSGTPVEHPDVLRVWLERQKEDGVRVALLGEVGFALEPDFLAHRGLAPVRLAGALRLGRADELVGFEAAPVVHAQALPEIQAVDPSVRVHLSVADDSGQEAAAILTSDWGGIALGPYVLEEGFAGRWRWVLNPFTFLEAALAPEPFPVPDVTTENGRRLLVVHVDAEGLATREGSPCASPKGQAALESLLVHPPLPATLSLDREGPCTSPRGGARRMARLSHVEVLTSPAPVGGGPGLLDLDNPSLTGLSPLLEPSGERVYSPLVDARAYSLLAWPPYAYSRLAEVLERTDRPRRLAPLALYFPLEACDSPAGLRALESLRSHALARPTLPLWLGEYAARAMGFSRVTLSRQLDGAWWIRGLGALRTLRLPAALGWPDPRSSTGVAGFLETPQGRYVSLSASEARLVLAPRPPAGPVLAWANAPLVSWRGSPSPSLRLRGHLPVSLALSGVREGCRLVGPAGSLPGVPGEGVRIFHFPEPDTGDARLVCP